MKRQLSLDYTLGEGWLAPWVDALRRGTALASLCGTCGAAQFPPLRTCPKCRRASDGWAELSGGAAVLFRTTGTDGDVAMVQFDGADCSAIVRCETLPPGATRARIMACPDGPPMLRIEPEKEP